MTTEKWFEEKLRNMNFATKEEVLDSLEEMLVQYCQDEKGVFDSVAMNAGERAILILVKEGRLKLVDSGRVMAKYPKTMKVF